jgi:hypothetical protein
MENRIDFSSSHSKGNMTSVPARPVSSEEGKMEIFNRSNRFAAAVVIGMGLLGAAQTKADAADYGTALPPPRVDLGSVPCDVGWAGAYTLLPAYWTSAWLGHFSGGESYYDRDRGVTALTWGDEKRCFPSPRACNAWVASLRREYHRPAGYWSCTILR